MKRYGIRRSAYKAKVQNQALAYDQKVISSFRGKCRRVLWTEVISSQGGGSHGITHLRRSSSKGDQPNKRCNHLHLSLSPVGCNSFRNGLV